MNAFPDTSFLCAFYRQQDNSEAAAHHFATMTEPLFVSALLLYEFRQSIRFQRYRHDQDAKVGFTATEAMQALADLQSDLAAGVVVLVAVDWAQVLVIAERLSAQNTPGGGHRSLDVLHLATALHLGAREFLSFDANQRKLAKAEGLVVKP